MTTPLQDTASLTTPAYKRRYSLRWRLLALLSSMILVTLLVIGASVFFFIFENEQRTWQNRQQENARHAAETVGSFIERTQETLRLVSFLDRNTLQNSSAILQDWLFQSPALLEIVRLDENGEVLASAHRDAPLLSNLFTIPQSRWFTEGQAGRLYLSSLQISAASQPYIIMSVPAPDGGVVAARLRMNLLWDVVAALKFGQTGQAYVVNPAGQIVGHPDPQVALAQTNLTGRPELEELQAAPEQRWSGSYLNFEGVEVIGVTIPVPGTSWVVITEVAESEVFGVSRTALLLLGGGMAVFGMLLLVVTSQFLGRLVLQPMENLRSGAVQIGRGNLNHRINLEERQDEMGQVAASFNEMVNRLHQRDTALKQQRAFLQQVIDINPHFIFAKDRGGRFTLANKAFAAAYNSTVEALLDNFDIDFNPNKTLVAKYRQDDLEVMDSRQELFIAEEKVIRPDGEVLWRQTIKRPIIDQEGQANQVLGVATDITDRKRIEQALATARDEALEASRLKTQLLANVSHDLRTPLNAILGYTEMLQEGVFGELSEEQRGALLEIIDSTNQLLSFINNLLDQARIDAGRVAIRQEPIKPADLIATVRSMHGVVAQTKGLELTSEIEPDVPDQVLGDPHWLGQILANLVSNAIKFTHEGGVHITIDRPNEDRWLLQVSDTGQGIPEEAQQYIFEAFRQVDGTVTRGHSGSGLGLSIVKELVNLMNGTITLTSKLNHGTTFAIELPLKPVPVQETAYE